MQNLNFLETELLDILFRGKNKDYGAYALRKNYSSRAKCALAYTILCVLLLFGVHQVLPAPDIPMVLIHESPYGGDITEITQVELGLPAGNEAAPALENTSAENIPTEVVPIESFKPEIIIDKPQNPIAPTTLGNGPTTTNPSLAGPGGGGTSKLPTTPGRGVGTGGVANSVPNSSPVILTELDIAEVMPEFPGGEDAMIKYLSSKMRYPSMASDVGVEGIVYVQFVVNTQGKISKLEVVKGIGMGCDKEAIRVIKSMPIWKPGMQDGHKVNVSFVLPVQFVL